MNFIDLNAQYQKIKPQLQNRIQSVLDHGRFVNGPEIDECESHLAQFTGAKHALLVASGTDALFLALMAYDIGPGDEVIVPAFSFFATAEVVSLLGATPVFCDVDSKTYNLDATKIEALITKKTKVIMPVSLYGQCAEMLTINEIAKKHQLKVIEDAAQSFGAKHHNKMSCNLSDIGCTSFFPAKPLGAYGDAGAVFTNCDETATKLKALRQHGETSRYHHKYLGITGRCDTLQAAILIEKLAIFPEELEARQAAATYYSQKLESKVRVPILMPHNTCAWAQYTIEVVDRPNFAKKLNDRGVPTAVHYPVTMNKQPVYMDKPWFNQSFKNSESAASRVLSLPMHPYISRSDQDKVIATILECLD